MAKSSKNKPFQPLSPENYIRQKARNLPIYECKVNNNWELEKIAQVLVARSHANGKITLCFYLVDLTCLGVKDTFYQFNIDSEEYSEMLREFDDKMLMKDISYELAHNIVYAGIEFAEEYGFKPHNDFTSVTRFMLLEDTDDVELIEIEVGGDDGNPLYINSGYETEARARQIVSQLEKTAGIGNFSYISPENMDETFEDFQSDEFDRDLELTEFMLDELKEEFLTLINKGIDDLSKVEISKLVNLSTEIYAEICDENKVYDYVEKWEKELDIEITDEYTNEFIGVDENFNVTTKQRNLVDEILSIYEENNKKARKKNKELESQIGKTSFIAAMELELLKATSLNELETKLADYLPVYPNCSLIKMMSHIETFKSEQNADLKDYLPDSDVIFEGRNSVTGYEMSRYLTDKLFLIAGLRNINMIEAFFLFLDDVNLADEAIDALKSLTGILRVSILDEYLENKS